MRKLRLLGLIGVLSLAVLLGSCLTFENPFVFDNSLAPEEQTSLAFIGIIPTSYNGISLTESMSYVVFPRGIIDFTANINSQLGNTIYTGKDAIFQYNFEGNKTYPLYFAIKDGLWGVNIYDGLPSSTGSQKNITHLAFVPFSNQRTN